MEAPKVFISHATEDKKYASKVKRFLDTTIAEPWIDNDQLKTGDISEQLKQALLESDYAIFILSNISIEKDWVISEYQFFLKNKERRQIIPILLGVKLPELSDEFRELQIIKCLQWDIDEESHALFERIRSIVVPEEASYFWYDQEHLDIALKRVEPSTFEKKMVNYLLKLGDNYRVYLFKKLEYPEWFPWLKQMGFFLFPEYEPLPSLGPSLDGRFWHSDKPVRQYLQKVSHALSQPRYEELREEFWEIFSTENDLFENTSGNVFQRRLEHFPAILAQAEQSIIPNWLIEQAATWKNPTYINSQLLTLWLPKLIEGKPPQGDRLAAVETLLRACLKVEYVGERFRMGVDPFRVLSELKGEGLMRKIGGFCSEAFMRFIADQLAAVCSAKANGVHFSLPEINGRSYQVFLSLISAKEAEVKVYYITPKAVRKRKAEIAQSSMGDFGLRFRPYAEEDREDIGQFRLHEWESLSGLQEQLVSYLERRNLLLSEEAVQLSRKERLARLIPSLAKCQDRILRWLSSTGSMRKYPNPANATIEKALSPLFYDPYDEPMRESSLRSLGPHRWHDNEGKYAPLILLLELMQGVIPGRTDLARQMITEWLSPQTYWETFTRVSLQLIQDYWRELGDLFWSWLAMSNSQEIFETYTIKAELAYLIQDRWADFTASEKQTWLKFVQSSHLETGLKLDWLAPGKEDPLVSPTYKKLTSQNGGHEGDLMPEGFRRTLSPYNRSPLSKDELLAFTPSQLAAYLQSFEPENKMGGSNVEGLADQVRLAVTERPEWLADQLGHFEKTAYLYARAIADGIEKAVEAGQDVNWQAYLTFFLRYIDQEEFWQNTFVLPGQRRGGEYKYFLRGYVHLLEALCQKEELQDQVLDLWDTLIRSLALISDHLDSNRGPSILGENVGAVERAINDLGGRMLLVVIRLAVIKAKSENPHPTEGQAQFEPTLKSIWQDQLQAGHEATFAIFGQQIDHLYSLDANWVKEQLKALETDEGNWWPVMQGFLSNGQDPSQSTYTLMQPFYLRFEKEKLSEYRQSTQQDNIHAAYVNHLGIAYLQGWESLDAPSPWGRLVRTQNTQELTGFVSLRQRWSIPASMGDPQQDFLTQVNQRIIDFWAYLYHAYQEKGDALTAKDQQIVGMLGLLISRLPSLDQPYQDWVAFSIQHLPNDRRGRADHYMQAFLQLITRLSQQDLRPPIANLFEPLATKHLPAYPKPTLKKLLMYLAESQDPEVLDATRRICNAYAAGGHQELVEEVAKTLG